MAGAQQLWSTTPNNNQTADPEVNQREGMAPSQVNDAARQIMAKLKAYLLDTSGSIITGGSGTAYTLTSSEVFSSLTDRAQLGFRVHTANTAAATLNVDGLGAKPLRKAGNAELVANDLVPNTAYTAVYAAGIDSGAWLLREGTRKGLIDAVFALLGAITPSQLTGNVNDYNPTGLDAAAVVRLSSDNSRVITGLAGGSSGRVLVLQNVGTNPIILSNEDGASIAANRFAIAGDINTHFTLRPREVTFIQYDTTASRWRVEAGLRIDHVNRYGAAQGFSQATLTDAVTIVWDGDTQQCATVTLGGNRTLGAISNPRAGFTYLLRVVQDGTGNRTLNLSNTIYKFPGGTEPVLSTAPNAIDLLSFYFDGTSMLGAIQRGFA
jgi:hypothetical protein